MLRNKILRITVTGIPPQRLRCSSLTRSSTLNLPSCRVPDANRISCLWLARRYTAAYRVSRRGARRLPRVRALALGHFCATRTLHSHPPLAPSTRTLHSHPPLVDRAQLVRAGHEVRLYIAPEYLSLVPTVAGLSIIGTQQTIAAGMEKLVPHIATGNAAAMVQAVFEITTEYFAREADALKAVCAGWAEIVTFNVVAVHVGLAVTEALHIKALATNVTPGLPTRELFPFKSGLPKCVHMFCWWLFFKLTEPASSAKRPSGRLPTVASPSSTARGIISTASTRRRLALRVDTQC